MTSLIDTNVAVDLRDREPAALAWLAKQAHPPILSVISRIELENGVYREPSSADNRRLATEILLGPLLTLEFGMAELLGYRAIVARAGFSRPRILDRMIAATALVHGLTLATRNPRDFADIDGLSIESW